VYDEAKCLEILIENFGLSCEEAIDYFEFNVVGAYLGEKTPVFITFL